MRGNGGSKGEKVKYGHGDLESIKVRELEAEIEKLRRDLSDSKETVEILKQVISDNTQRPKQKE